MKNFLIITNRQSSCFSNGTLQKVLKREDNKEFINFLSMPKGSHGEVRSQLIRAFDRNFNNENEFNDLKNDLTDLSKMISGFMRYLKILIIMEINFSVLNFKF